MTDEDKLRAMNAYAEALKADSRADVGGFLPPGTPDERRELLAPMLDTGLFTLICVLRKEVSFREFLAPYGELSDEQRQTLFDQKQRYERRASAWLGARPGPVGAREGKPAHPILPEYTDWEEKARGAMAVVWMAMRREPPIGREVFKVPHRHIVDERGWAAVLDEAKAASEIDHPNVCKILDVDQLFPYIRMPYVDGPTLEDWAPSGQRPPLDRVADLAAQVCRGLHAIHGAGLLHRDLKPANVIVAAGLPERAVIIDFGLAGPRGLADGAGTPAYMAPEQVPESVRGHRAMVDARADVYAVGAILYRLVEGCPPFTGSREEVFAQVLRDPPRFTSTKWAAATPGLRAVCARALAKDPARRYASAAEMADDLEAFVRGEPPKAWEAGLLRRSVYRLKRRRRQAAAVVVGTVLLAVLVVLGWQRYLETGRAKMVADVEALLKNGPIDTKRSRRIEALLNTLGRDAPSVSDDLRGAYVDALIGEAAEQVGRQPDQLDLARIEENLVTLTQRDAARADRLRRSGVWERFVSAALPYLRSASYYSYLRPDSHRIEHLERLVSIDGRLRSEGASVAAQMELFRAYFARGDQKRGDLEHAHKLIAGLAARPDLSAAWRMTVLRDLTWLAIWSSVTAPDGRTSFINEALTLIDAALARDPTPDSVYLPLLVEKARLLAAKDQHAAASRVVDQYFARLGHLEFGATDDLDTRLGERAARENLPARFFLDGALLRGFLAERPSDRRGGPPSEKLRALWAEAHALVRNEHVGAYYEGAMLASLAGQLEVPDAIRMVLYTSSGAKSVGSSPVIDELMKTVEGNRLASGGVWSRASAVATGVIRGWSAVDFIAQVLRNAWTTDPGYSYAREIAFRRISYGEYLHVQLRLWLFEGLCRSMAGTTAGKESLSQDERDLVWKLTGDAFEAFREGELTEQNLVGLVHVGLDRDGVKHWPKAAAKLPAALHGPVAYVLYRTFHTRLQDPKAAQVVRATVVREAATASPDSPLARLAAE